MEMQSKGFFWPSYADLMTSLFVIMLVLFILSFKLFKDREQEMVAQNEKLEVIEQEYNKIKEIDYKDVNLLRKFWPPLAPKTVWLAPAPNVAPASAPFPACSRTIIIRAMQTRTWSVINKVFMERLLLDSFSRRSPI